MDRITKVFFDPLATTKAQIRALLRDSPIGSAHPFSPERLLLCRTADGIDEIDISSYEEKDFFNAVDLGELGQTLQTRMTKFTALRTFNDEYTVMQAPSPTFKVPLESDKIAILAVSERYPTYYDLCVADSECKTSCYGATDTFRGMTHSSDINLGSDLLHHIKLTESLEEGKPFTIFVSGYSRTKLTRFKERNPVVMIANHEEKSLYIIPVPLDTASIGNATICSPVVVKREGTTLVCSILPAPTTDLDKMCSGSSLQSRSFGEAIERADWVIPAPRAAPALPSEDTSSTMEAVEGPVAILSTSEKQHAVFITQATVLPTSLALDTTQIIRFGTGIEYLAVSQDYAPEITPSAVVLPCILGAQLAGPLLLATGTAPKNVPAQDEHSLRACYEKFERIVVFVDERMTDNARNLAGSLRINAVFVIQVKQEAPSERSDVKKLLDSVNINAVTALAGPQSLVLVQINSKYHFYRGIGNGAHLNTSTLEFSADITHVVETAGLQSLLDARVKRIVDIREACTVLLPSSGQTAEPQSLKDLFEKLSLDDMKTLEDDVSAIVPQLQVLLNQKEIVDLSQSLIAILSSKVSSATAPLRNNYISFITREYDMNDSESIKKKNVMLGDLRRSSKALQKSLESIISHLSNMMTSQTTSKKTHDMQRLQRQAAIQNNVESVKSMTFDTLSNLLETKAVDMGVLLLNIETMPYKQLLRNLKANCLDATACCELDSRTLYLEGFDAGIILEQSQANHDGPLKHQLGASHPVLALPYLSQERGNGSMLAFVCWDEFVNLKSPFQIRWMEKCNEPHIAALRIMMRDTLSNAVASREFSFQPGSPEIGQLMSALLMAGMSKLTSMRITTPTLQSQPQDTVTKLMRGLFGNLLTSAGSGVRPLSMVWQLFGQEPKFEVPSSGTAWNWYEKVVQMYPFSGWPREQFNLNLEKLLDKALIAVVSKNEVTEKIKSSRGEQLKQYCKLRNIQLDHSRTILTILTRIMDTDVDRKAVATRLLAALPAQLEKQSRSYTKMIRYLKHLASTGMRQEDEDLVVVSVYLKRSAVFRDLKLEVAKTCKAEDYSSIKTACLKLFAKFNEIVESWELPKMKLVMQNMKAFSGLLDTFSNDSEELDDALKKQRKDFMLQAISDAEQCRMPWQVGKDGEFGDNIEPVDEAFVQEVLTGETAPASALTLGSGSGISALSKPQGMQQFTSLVTPDFISKMDSVVGLQDVCKIMNIPVSTMIVFATALNPEFPLADEIGKNFTKVVIDLLTDRKQREKQQPTRTLFGMEREALEAGAVIEVVVEN